MGKLVESADGGLVVVSLTPQQEAKNNFGPPSYIKPGTGGKMVLTKEGRTIGPIGGELLRLALLRGGQIVGEKAVETFQKKSHNGLNIE
jgi:hypothetical protein